MPGVSTPSAGGRCQSRMQDIRPFKEMSSGTTILETKRFLKKAAANSHVPLVGDQTAGIIAMGQLINVLLAWN